MAGLSHRVEDTREIVGLRRLQRRELLVRIEFLLPKLLADRQHVPVIDEGGHGGCKRAAQAGDSLLAFADRLLERITLDILD